MAGQFAHDADIFQKFHGGAGGRKRRVQSPAGKRRNALTTAIEGLLEEDFRDRILSFDRPAARAYASIAAERRAAGRPISQFDCQIAAIARAREATVATRNASDYEGCGIALMNPWTFSIRQ